MKNKLLISLIFTASYLLTGCIESDKPLFPFEKWKQATPVKAGYYVMRDVRVENGEPDLYLPTEHPILIKQTGKNYQVLGDSKFDKLDTIQLYGAKTEKFILQAKKKKEDKGTGIFSKMYTPPYSYAQILKSQKNDGFILYENDCDFMNSTMREVLINNGWMKSVGGGCLFDKADDLKVILGGDAKIWNKYTLNYFYKTPDQPLPQNKLKDKVTVPIPAQSASKVRVEPTVIMGPAFDGAPNNAEGAHLRLISKTNRDNATIEWALLVEAQGDKLQNYAWISAWYDSPTEVARLSYSPTYIIKIASYMPKANVFDQAKIEPNIEEVRKQCERENPNEECGTIDEVISSYQNRGLKILLQGAQMLQFPDNTFAEGGLMTVMGAEGNTDHLVVLITYMGRTMGRGMTRVLYHAKYNEH